MKKINLLLPLTLGAICLGTTTILMTSCNANESTSLFSMSAADWSTKMSFSKIANATGAIDTSKIQLGDNSDEWVRNICNYYTSEYSIANGKASAFFKYLVVSSFYIFVNAVNQFGTSEEATATYTVNISYVDYQESGLTAVYLYNSSLDNDEHLNEWNISTNTSSDYLEKQNFPRNISTIMGLYEVSDGKLTANQYMSTDVDSYTYMGFDVSNSKTPLSSEYENTQILNTSLTDSFYLHSALSEKFSIENFILALMPNADTETIIVK